MGGVGKGRNDGNERERRDWQQRYFIRNLFDNNIVV